MKQSRIAVAASENDLLSYQSILDGKCAQWHIEFYPTKETLQDALLLNEFEIILIDSSLDGVSEEFHDSIQSTQLGAKVFVAMDEEESGKWNVSTRNVSVLPKPISEDGVVETLQNALAMESWLGQDRVKEIVSNLDVFPSLPHMYLKVMNALNSKDSSVEKIGHIISDDVGITAKVLQVVNSSYYGFEEEIADVTHAVSVLGVEHVKSLVLAIQVFGDAEDRDKQAITDGLLKHSLSVANAAKRIAMHHTGSEKLAAESYTAGLLHDLGKLVLLKSDFEKTKAAWVAASEENESPWVLENRTLGASHTAIGAYVLGRWGMPISIVEAAAFHHEPANGMSVSSFTALAAVHIANAVVWGKARSAEDHPDAKFDTEFLNLLGVQSDWEYWKLVSEGEEPTRKKIGLKRNEAGESDEEENVVAAPAVTQEAEEASPEEALQKEEIASITEEESPEEKKSKKGVFIGVGLAACAAFGGWMLMSNSPSEDSIAFEDESWSNDVVVAEAIDDVEERAELVDQIAESEVVEESVPDVVEEPELAAVVEEPVVEQSAEVVELPKPVIQKTVSEFPLVELAGIFYNESNPAATVNGKIVRVGSRVSGTEVVSITRKFVTLRFEDQVKTLKLN